MKRIVLMVVIACATAFMSVAQEVGIDFQENPEFSSVLKSAKKSGKYIFIDCYTTWCGPCKMLAKNVFTKPEVADFYNANFINVKYDMEKGEGITLKDRFNVTAFPTMLWLDGKGNIVHKIIGAGNAQYILEQGTIAADPENNLAGLTKRFDAGERTSDVLNKYISALKLSGQSEKQNEVTVAFVANMTKEDLSEERNFRLLEENVKDPLAAPMQIVYANKAYFVSKIGEERVNKQCETCLQGAFAVYIAPHQPEGWSFDMDRWQKMVDFCSSLEDMPEASHILVQLYMAKAAEVKAYEELISTFRTAMKYNMVQGMMKSYITMFYLKKIGESGDVAIIKQGVALADDILASWKEERSLANIYESKARLQILAGDEKAGLETRAIGISKKQAYIEKTGGRAMIMGNL